MSASTVSITANPAAARRRPVLVGEKKSNTVELFPNEAQAKNGGDTGNVTGNDKVAQAHSKDLSHNSIRGEAILERTSKDPVLLRKSNAVNSTVSPRRGRKLAQKPVKPRWVTVASVFTKNFALLLVLVGLVQLIRGLASKSEIPNAGTMTGLAEIEGRIAEVESLLKTTAKMMQVQVEVVDKKIENEIGGLRHEVNHKLDDRNVNFDAMLRKLETRSEELEKLVADIKAGDWLSKDEFGKFYEELKETKDVQHGEDSYSLDVIRAYAKEIVEKEIQKHAADGLGKVDYALAEGGAFVLKHSEFFGKPSPLSNWFQSPRGARAHPDASKMLRPSFGEPGQCFPLKGTSGFVEISLRKAIVPEAVTLEHVAKSVAYDRSSAPRDCRVTGWLRGADIASPVETEKMLLTEFTYDLEKSNAQTFNVLASSASRTIDTVRLDFTSNHGSHTHTCIYRFRVHGYEPDSGLVRAPQN
ncbi:SUN domain-containing protein 1 [Linum grandiflorum]